LLSEPIIAEMHIEKAFFSCSGFSVERGTTEVHFEEAQLKRKAIESSQQVIALIDSSKFGKEDLTPFACPNQITHLFTNSAIDNKWKTRLERTNILFTVCVEDSIPT
jgi:DeoR/GlpR family transcriptional regulator of sugar metabolism